jgi:hypothetical protein
MSNEKTDHARPVPHAGGSGIVGDEREGPIARSEGDPCV